MVESKAKETVDENAANEEASSDNKDIDDVSTLGSMSMISFPLFIPF